MRPRRTPRRTIGAEAANAWKSGFQGGRIGANPIRRLGVKQRGKAASPGLYDLSNGECLTPAVWEGFVPTSPIRVIPGEVGTTPIIGRQDLEETVMKIGHD
jgi:hypothetical protein